MKILAKTLPFLLLVVLFMPGTASAVADLAGGSIGLFVANIISFMNKILVPLIFAIAFLVFLWGMFTTFILGGSDEEKQSQGKSLMLYAIVGFVLMVSLWGIVNLVAAGFGLQDASVNNMPNLPVTRP
jgi:hypothetical protein